MWANPGVYNYTATVTSAITGETKTAATTVTVVGKITQVVADHPLIIPINTLVTFGILIPSVPRQSFCYHVSLYCGIAVSDSQFIFTIAGYNTTTIGQFNTTAYTFTSLGNMTIVTYGSNSIGGVSNTSYVRCSSKTVLILTLFFHATDMGDSAVKRIISDDDSSVGRWSKLYPKSSDRLDQLRHRSPCGAEL